MEPNPVRYVPPVYRPPSEAESLILPVTDGCSWNKCTFCEMYTDAEKRFRPRSEEEIVETIPLNAPDADAMGLELAAFLAAVRGDRAAIVTAREGRAALALAAQVTAAVQRTPVPALGR